MTGARVATTRRAQRRPWKWLISLLPFAIAIAGPIVLHRPYAWILTSSSALIGIAVSLTWLMGRGDGVYAMTEAKHGALELAPAELVVRAGARSERFDRAEVASGWVETEHASTYLVLQMKSGVVVRAALPREEGERVLAELGMAHDPRAMTLRLGSPQPVELGGTSQRSAESAVLGCAGIFTGAIAVMGIINIIGRIFAGATRLGTSVAQDIMVAAGFTVLFGLMTYYLFDRIRQRIPPVPTVAHIGAEGVEPVRRWRRRWIPFTALESVTSKDEKVYFQLPARVEVVTTAGAAEARAVVERVRAAQAWATRGSTAHRIEQLDRGGRTLDQWRGALEALSAKGAAGYREVAISAETLAQVWIARPNAFPMASPHQHTYLGLHNAAYAHRTTVSAPFGPAQPGSATRTPTPSCLNRPRQLTDIVYVSGASRPRRGSGITSTGTWGGMVLGRRKAFGRATLSRERRPLRTKTGAHLQGTL